MRKLRDGGNVYAERGRLEKAIVLSSFIAKHFAPVTQELVDVLPEQPHEWWQAVCKETDTKYPSLATMEAVVGMLSQQIAEPQRSPVFGL